MTILVIDRQRLKFFWELIVHLQNWRTHNYKVAELENLLNSQTDGIYFPTNLVISHTEGNDVCSADRRC